MKKKVVNICIILILFLVLTSIISTKCYAMDEILAIELGDDTGTDEIKELGGIILKVVQVVGTAAAIIMLLICAINFMLAAPEGKAEYKKRLVPIVIGSVILFGASNILVLLQTVVSGSLGK